MLWLREYTVFMFFWAAEYENNSKIHWLALVFEMINMNRKLLALMTCPFGLSMVFCFRTIPFHHPAITT
jgi:hypothetical protein